MQAIIRDYCEQLYVSELGNLEDNKLPEQTTYQAKSLRKRKPQPYH